MPDPLMIAVSVVYRHADGTAIARMWPVTAEVAEDLARQMGPPYAEQMMPAEVLQEMGDISESVPLVIDHA